MAMAVATGCVCKEEGHPGGPEQGKTAVNMQLPGAEGHWPSMTTPGIPGSENHPDISVQLSLQNTLRPGWPPGWSAPWAESVGTTPFSTVLWVPAPAADAHAVRRGGRHSLGALPSARRAFSTTDSVWAEDGRAERGTDTCTKTRPARRPESDSAPAARPLLWKPSNKG
ncbi:uncharacterized protein LOC128587764 isoform X2 [Nycticebus coucang]|uniref:uncharacterized protein LOC128587764 isoform X2 n=1 Tax=Nycticebus coucang TaxID=9470 RepID=UPI00234E0CC7|nr:uncharacterized protein LOC128587764 isoform X2 [Nycticebus coucang]